MIGQLRELVEFQEFDRERDSVGQSIKTAVAKITTRAQCRYLFGRELEAAQKINTQVSLEITTRYRTDLNTKMQMRWRDLNWNLHAILPDDRKKYQRMFASRIA